MTHLHRHFVLTHFYVLACRSLNLSHASHSKWYLYNFQSPKLREKDMIEPDTTCRRETPNNNSLGLRVLGSLILLALLTSCGSTALPESPLPANAYAGYTGADGVFGNYHCRQQSFQHPTRN